MPLLRGSALVVMLASVISLDGPAAATCVGDCNGDCSVVITELITLVNIALGNAPVSNCTPGDTDADGAVIMNEMVAAVAAALDGCPATDCSRCGNCVINPGEACDDGGLCIGGANAGTPCGEDEQCEGDGVCDGGSKLGFGCASDSDCPGSHCIHCKAFGGDGCASNCTAESDVSCDLVPGITNGLEVKSGTSGVMIKGEGLTIPFEVAGRQTLTVGQPVADGAVPVVVKVGNAMFERIPFTEDNCACLRPVALQTCGGILFEADGSPARFCNENFLGSVRCPASKPCASVYGPGNSATGVFDCSDHGLLSADVSLTRDAGGCGNPPDCTQRDSGPIVTTFSGGANRGASRLLSTTALGVPLAAVCLLYTCTDSEPIGTRGQPQTFLLTTGSISAEIRNVNFGDTMNLGPVSLQGTPASCGSPPSVAGMTLVGASLELAKPTFGDAIVTQRFVCR